MAGAPLTDDEAPSTLRALRAARAAGEPLVVAQLGQSLDGRIATASGHSHYVNGPAALDLLHRLRACVDAVVVGAGTARADDPRLTVRRASGPDPARVLIDRRRTAGGRLRLLHRDGVRRIVFGPPHPDDPAGVEHVPADGPLPPAAILDALAERGFRRVLVEGGSSTVSGFLAADALDRLCLLVAPLLIGSGTLGIALPPILRMEEAMRPTVEVRPLPGGDVLFDCNFRTAQNVAW